jgi:hypothetical protein
MIEMSRQLSIPDRLSLKIGDTSIRMSGVVLGAEISAVCWPYDIWSIVAELAQFANG